MNELCKTAIDWRKLGYSVIPISMGGKNPLVKWKEYIDKPASIANIINWFRSGDINIAVLCGGANNLAVVDFDTQTGYYSAMARLDKTTRNIALHTFKVKTGRGVHIFFNVKTRTRKNVEDKIDIKADGGYVLVPPSVHPSGKVYKTINGATINDIVSIDEPMLLNIANIKDEEGPDCEKPEIDFDKIERDNRLSFEEDDFDYVRNRMSILRVAMMYTPMYQKRGTQYWMGKCPLHKDNAPSFWVDTKIGIAKCYSTACVINSKAVDVIGLYALLNNITYVESMHRLIEML